MAKAKLPWILLAVSLALNLFFAGGVIYMRMTGPSDQRVEAVAERLGLSADRRAGLEAFRARVRVRMTSLREKRQAGRAEMLAELGRAELDRARLGELMNQGMAARGELFEELLVELHAYLGTLSDEQRRSFLKMAEERGFLRGLFGPERRRQ